MTRVTPSRPRPRDPLSLDDSWFDHPERSLKRDDVLRAAARRAPPQPAERDDSIQLDDPWFRLGD